MLIDRMHVDGGFLHGLDVHFVTGLNVLIGARGTGKTSLIELIRFALDARAFTQDAERRGKQQAISVLQGGQVTLELRDGQDHFVVSRGAKDEKPRAPRSIPPVTVLAQSEIEAVGAQASGRLLLIDRFLPNRRETEHERSNLISILRSLTAEIEGVRNDLQSINEQMQDMRTVRKDRSIAVERQQDLLRSIEATAKDRDQLVELQNRAAVLGVRSAVYERTTVNLNTLRQELGRMTSRLGDIEQWPETAGERDLLSGVRERISTAATSVRNIAEIIHGAEIEIQGLIEQNGRDRSSTEEKARDTRRTLEQLHTGAGELSRLVEALTEREARLTTLQSLALDRSARITDLQNQRREIYERLEKLQTDRYQERMRIRAKLNEDLRPEIKTDVIESGMVNNYVNTISAALRGSGLHYNTLAPLLANSMSPLELVEAVEKNDIQAITGAVEIADERAFNVIAYLRTRGLADLIAAPVDDAVELSLLDGIDYKKSDNLSIGQRCTVVLPVLLSRQGDLLIIDQPEDHLDNAFITETLVERLRERHPADQFILASHNANIPVLGEADLVIRFGSDGRRGFVEHVGELDAPATVQAITTVMEGGVKAFQRRAAFYEGVLGDQRG